MPSFDYIAMKNGQRQVKGKIEAADFQAARAQIRKMGLVPIKITEDTNFVAKEKKIKTKKDSIPELPLKDKIDFTSTLQILTSTGIPIIETLAFMEENAETKNVKKVCGIIKNQIVNGSTLAETLEKNRKAFGRVYAGLTRAGEDSGELDITLGRMLELLKKQANVKGKVIGALVYPVFVIVLAVLVVIAMLVFVFPAFESMFDSLGGKLPILTKVCIDAGVFLKEYWYVLILSVVFSIAGIIFIFKNEVTKKIVDRITLKIPLLSELMKFSNYSNFLAVLQVAYDAGIPVVNSLYLANLTIDNFVLREAISSAAIKVQQGTNLSSALKATKQIPNMMLFMIATGEQSGKLGEMLYNCTVYIDKKLDDIIDTFTKLVEPFMLIVIGGIVLFLALALYMPLFASYQQI